MECVNHFHWCIKDLFDSLSDTAESGADWTLRHGRSQALAVALKTAAPKIWTPAFQSNIIKCLSGLVDSDKVCSLHPVTNEH